MYLTKLSPLEVYLGGDPDELREKAVGAKLWRPTAVIIVQHQDRFLVSRHWVEREENGEVKWKIKPDLPKGGVDPEDDSVEAAAYRELGEEVCLHRHNVLGLRYLGFTLVPFDRHNKFRDGYRKGKLYLLYHARINDKGYVSPGLEHSVVSLEWLCHPATAFVKDGKYTKKGRILSSPELQCILGKPRRVA